MDYVGLGVLLVLLVVFAFLAYRAFRAKNKVVKWGGGVLALLGVLLSVASLGIALKGYSTLNTTYANPVANITVAMSPEQIAKGEKYARSCSGCHSPNNNVPLVGQDFAKDGPPVGTLWAPNLTPAHFQDWSDGEIARAIREGISKDGRSLIIMPSYLFHNMSDEDVQAIVAYLRSQPAVEPDTPKKNINVIGALMVGALFPPEIFSHQAPITTPIVAPPAGPTLEYGTYLIRFVGCTDCHGADLHGVAVANPNGPPAGPSLIPFVNRYSEDEFIKTIHSGVRPDGQPLGADMPWKDYSLFSDDDLRALYLYIKSLPQ